MKKATIQGRPGWDRMAAVQKDQIYEIKSTYILQPGPAALTDGVAQLHAILARVSGGDGGNGLNTEERRHGASDSLARAGRVPPRLRVSVLRSVASAVSVCSNHA